MRRGLGVLLLLGVYAPLHRLLTPARAGPAGASTRQAAEAAWSVGLYGSLIVVGTGFVLARVLPVDGLIDRTRSVVAALGRPGRVHFAVAVGFLSTALATAVAIGVFGGLPTSVDEMAQLLHARAVSAGALALPLPGAEAAWTVQNGVVTPGGWASIYPPFHTLALAAGLWLGLAWLVGPLAAGIGAFASALALEHLLGARVGRVAALVTAVAPFWLLLGATHLSHTTAAAGLALVLWTGLRARDGSTWWAVVTGAAVGVAVSSRPWVGFVCSAAILITLWWPVAWHAHDLRLGARRAAATLSGGLPFALLLFWWNTRLFGHPFELGYSAAFGPAHGLGLHVDPWGNVYGLVEALAYTGADLVQLGTHLLETPLPALAVIGVALLVGRAHPSWRPLVAWAVAAVAANALYWHHGVHMGPRMLYESVPAWVGLFVASIALLVSEGLAARVRPTAIWSVAIMAIGGVLLAAGIVTGARAAGGNPSIATTPPALPGSEAALVFVHGSWSSRLVARLVATGMRRDSIETVLRRNDVCQVDRYVRWREAEVRDGPPPALDLEARPGTPITLETRELSPGNLVRVSRALAPDEACARQARADRFGTLELEPLIWQAPPLPDAATAVARDLGREVNDRVRSALGRRAYVYVERGPGGGPLVLGYEEGMRLLWEQ